MKVGFVWVSASNENVPRGNHQSFFMALISSVMTSAFREVCSVPDQALYFHDIICLLPDIYKTEICRQHKCVLSHLINAHLKKRLFLIILDAITCFVLIASTSVHVRFTSHRKFVAAKRLLPSSGPIWGHSKSTAVHGSSIHG